MRIISLCLAVIVLAAATTARAAKFDTLIDFGDSLSDIGNDLSITFGSAPGAPGYYQGRFSNGPIWVDQLAKRLNLAAPKPSASKGNDYAYGGVTTGTGSTVLNPNGFIKIRAPNIETQVTNWAKDNTATNSQLFTLLGGGNDFFAVIDGSSKVTAQSVADNLRDSIQALYDDKARNVIIGNLPDLGLIPRYLKTAKQAQATKLTADFNTALTNDLDALVKKDAGLNLYRLDLYDQFNSVIKNPKAYGLTNVTDAAYTGDTDYAGKGKVVAADPSKYLFWDSVHPTTVTQVGIGDLAFGLLPEPQGIALILVGAVVLLRRQRCPEGQRRFGRVRGFAHTHFSESPTVAEGNFGFFPSPE